MEQWLTPCFPALAPAQPSMATPPGGRLRVRSLSSLAMVTCDTRMRRSHSMRAISRVEGYGILQVDRIEFQPRGILQQWQIVPTQGANGIGVEA